jgi:hypothetical protein
MEETSLREFANKYTAAWCSQNSAPKRRWG